MRGVSAIFVGWKRWVTAAILASAVTFGSARAFDWGEPIRTTVVIPPPIPIPPPPPVPPEGGPPDSNPTPPSEAPEPATLSLALAGAAALLVRRRKSS
jgi:hypothetical protein